MDRDLLSYNVKPVGATTVNVQISGEPRSFATLQGAFDLLANEDELKTKTETMSGNLVFDRGINTTLSGGWNADFTSVSGYTRINGTLTVQSGSLVVKNLITGS